MFVEVNVDALVGPTHHFAGVGVGNVASHLHRSQASHPRRAALEGLSKAWRVAQLGIPQFVLPPPVRPRCDLLAELGFHGTSVEQLEASSKEALNGYAAALSSAFMWCANAGTFVPACDAGDQCGHLSLANLNSSWHRSLEASERMPQFVQLFRAIPRIKVHAPLPSIQPLRDEGAANHMRLSNFSGDIGLHVFVYGESDSALVPSPSRFTPRQTLAACQTIARRHQLPREQTFFLQQHPRAIDAGVFHNDVIATSHHALLIHHEFAFWDADPELKRLEDTFRKVCGEPLTRIMIRDSELPLTDAVTSYFFNSQLLTRHCAGTGIIGSEDFVGFDADNEVVLLCAEQCRENSYAHGLVTRLLEDANNPIGRVEYVSLDESMAGGGGPACLRLRLQVKQDEVAKLAPEFRLTPTREAELRKAIGATYPEQIHLADLCDPALIADCQRAATLLRDLFRASSLEV